MAKMARIVDGLVSDIITPVSGFTLEQCFHHDVLAQYVAVVDEAEIGWAEADAVIVVEEPTPEAEAEPEAKPAIVEEVPVEGEK